MWDNATCKKNDGYEVDTHDACFESPLYGVCFNSVCQILIAESRIKGAWGKEGWGGIIHFGTSVHKA